MLTPEQQEQIEKDAAEQAHKDVTPLREANERLKNAMEDGSLIEVDPTTIK
jgi:hypothetical protein